MKYAILLLVAFMAVGCSNYIDGEKFNVVNRDIPR